MALHPESLSPLKVIQPNITPLLQTDRIRLRLSFPYMPDSDLGKAKDEKDMCSLSRARAYQLWIDLAAALSHCHGLGIVHCDIKPQNILQGAEFKLCDFGLATEEGKALGIRGTPGYIPPELLAGDLRRPGLSKTAFASDIYALGIVVLWAFEFIPLPRVHFILSKLYSLGPEQQQFVKWIRGIEAVRRKLPTNFNLLARMLDRSVTSRIPARELLLQLPTYRTDILEAQEPGLLVAGGTDD